MDGGAWKAAVHGVVKSQTRLRDLTFTFHFSLSCIGEGNGNPLQCSCLENPRDGGAWWAAVYGVAQSWTRLKLLSSSNTLFLILISNFFSIKNCFKMPLAKNNQKIVSILLWSECLFSNMLSKLSSSFI